jgi:hypothetical protein
MDLPLKDEHEFIRWLEGYLDGAIVKRNKSHPAIDVGKQFKIQVKKEPKRGKPTDLRPDIELSHEIEFDLSHPIRREAVTSPTSPAWTECKIGSGYTGENVNVQKRSDTGIAAIQREFAGQLPKYQYDNKKYHPTDSPKITVLVTCPYMLDGVFDGSDLPDFSVKQFEQTLRGLNLGWIYRHKNGIVLQIDSNNSYLILDSGYNT